MKRIQLLTVIGAALIVMFLAFRPKPETAIVGRINPVAGANMAWAVSGRDSTSSTIVNGAFSLSARPGIYKLVIDAVEPYKDAVLENISVKDGETIDVGEIVLQK